MEPLYALSGCLMQDGVLTLTPATVLGLFFIHRYRFLTIAQVGKAAGLSKRHVEDVLHEFDTYFPLSGTDATEGRKQGMARTTGY